MYDREHGAVAIEGCQGRQRDGVKDYQRGRDGALDEEDNSDCQGRQDDKTSQ
jgi:hypothetical protein